MNYRQQTRPGFPTRTWPRLHAFDYDPAQDVLMRCSRCDRKVGNGPLKGIRLWHVGPRYDRRWGQEGAFSRYQSIGPAESWNLAVVTCADQAECRAYRDKKRKDAQKRSGELIWRCSRFEKMDLPKGHCRWCGEKIVLVDPKDYRRAQRQYHQGDEHEEGDTPDCKREKYRSICWTGRDLIHLRGDPACVDCGKTDDDEWEDTVDDYGPTRVYIGPGWDADHDHPLWDGGEHCVTNIVRRCGDCHKRKTKEEAGERARRRRAQLELAA